MAARRASLSAQWGSGGRSGAAAAAGTGVGVTAVAAPTSPARSVPVSGDSDSDSSPVVFAIRTARSPPHRRVEGQASLAAQPHAAASPLPETVRPQEQRLASRRPSRRESEGPPVLVAVVGAAGSRWSGQRAADVVGQLLKDALGQVPADISTPYVCGFAILRSWRVLGASSSTTLARLRAALASEHRRCGPCFFLEHEVLRCCSFATPVPLVDCALSGNVASRQAAQLAQNHRDATAFLHGRVTLLRLGEVSAVWRCEFDLPEAMFVWPAAPVFAAGLARGLIRHDLSIVLRKNVKGC